MNVIAGVAVTLRKALQPEFRAYCRDVLTNAKILAEELMARGCKLVTGGTDNHMMVVDTVSSFDINGRIAEETLDAVSITVNKQLIPDDPNPPLRPSGIRLGSPAATTRGLGAEEMRRLAGWIAYALEHREDSDALSRLRNEVEDLCLAYPIPGIEAHVETATTA